MASRRSHAASHSRNANQRRVIRNFVSPCPEGTRIYQKPTASSEGAQLWDKYHLILSWFRKAGPTIILNIIRDASVPLRGPHSSYSISLLSKAAWLRRDAIASYDYPFSAEQFDDIVAFEFNSVFYQKNRTLILSFNHYFVILNIFSTIYT